MAKANKSTETTNSAVDNVENDSVNAAKNANRDAAIVITNAADDGFTLTDGGEIVGGWAPQLAPGVSQFNEQITAEKIEKGKVVSTEKMVTGKLALGSAWNKPCYLLENDGKPSLRLPESTGLYNALSRFKYGAELKIVYGGTVKVDKGFAHKWDVYAKDIANFRLSTPRADSLKLLSEAQKEANEKLSELREELYSLQTTVQIKQIEATKQKLLAQANDVVDAEFENADDFAFGMNLDAKSKA